MIEEWLLPLNFTLKDIIIIIFLFVKFFFLGLKSVFILL